MVSDPLLTSNDELLERIRYRMALLQSQCLEAYEVGTKDPDKKLTALAVAAGVALACSLEVQRLIDPGADPLRRRVEPLLRFTPPLP